MDTQQVVSHPQKKLAAMFGPVPHIVAKPVDVKAGAKHRIKELLESIKRPNNTTHQNVAAVELIEKELEKL